MKIFTNEGNPFGLKLQLLAKFANKPVQVIKVTLNGKSKGVGIPNCVHVTVICHTLVKFQ